jgi:hypothetical protein
VHLLTHCRIVWGRPTYDSAGKITAHDIYLNQGILPPTT